MKSCPAYLRQAVEDYESMKAEVQDLNIQLSNLKTKGTDTEKKIVKLNNKINSKRKILQGAKKSILNSHVFIVPVRKTLYD